MTCTCDLQPQTICVYYPLTWTAPPSRTVINSHLWRLIDLRVTSTYHHHSSCCDACAENTNFVATQLLPNEVKGSQMLPWCRVHGHLYTYNATSMQIEATYAHSPLCIHTILKMAASMLQGMPYLEENETKPFLSNK